MSDDPGKRHCLHCGRELEEGAHGHRRYCTQECYRSAADARARQSHGIDPTTPKRAYTLMHAGSGAGLISFVEIGARLGMSHECARQICARALSKLKAQPEVISLLAIAADLDAARAERLRELASGTAPANHPQIARE